uniref:Uncharacterized protein n=1 Tax=Monodelphis domestica TaxID=13616 RepID=A0A5F8GJL5_MONDO
ILMLLYKMAPERCHPEVTVDNIRSATQAILLNPLGMWTRDLVSFCPVGRCPGNVQRKEFCRLPFSHLYGRVGTTENVAPRDVFATALNRCYIS